MFNFIYKIVGADKQYIEKGSKITINDFLKLLRVHMEFIIKNVNTEKKFTKY